MARASARFWQEIDDAQEGFLARVRTALRELTDARLRGDGDDGDAEDRTAPAARQEGETMS